MAQDFVFPLEVGLVAASFYGDNFAVGNEYGEPKEMRAAASLHFVAHLSALNAVRAAHFLRCLRDLTAPLEVCVQCT